jgi:hypothetical protein
MMVGTSRAESFMEDQLIIPLTLRMLFFFPGCVKTGVGNDEWRLLVSSFGNQETLTALGLFVSRRQ